MYVNVILLVTIYKQILLLMQVERESFTVFFN